MTDSPATMRRHIAKLVKAGYLEERHNPKHQWDRCLQYRPNTRKIQDDLQALGYSLEGYSLFSKDAFFKIKNAFSKTENQLSDLKNRTIENEKAIPEITSETPIEKEEIKEPVKVEAKPDNANAPSPPISKVTKPKKVKPEKPPIPPAILAYQRTAQYYPEKAIWETIVATVGDTPAGLQLWTDIIKAWILLGWNKRNASGMLDFYSRGEIPGKGNNHNGQTSATATGSGNSIGSGANGSQGSSLDDVSKQLAAAFLKKSRPIVPRT